MRSALGAMLTAVLAGALLPFGAPTAGAASDTQSKSIPVNEFDQLVTHVWLECGVPPTCSFTVGAHLMTPNGPAGFPKQLWARQSTEVRSRDRTVYLDVHADGGPLTKVFKSLGWADITSIYTDVGPPEKYQTNGVIDVLDQTTGRPRTDAKANVIVCTHIQVTWSGVNLTSPATCAQTTF